MLASGFVATPAMAGLVPAPAARIGRMPNGEAALGFDFGTSGARCAALGADGAPLCDDVSVEWGADRERLQSASDWVEALHALLDAVPSDVRSRVSRIGVSGTSGTCLLCDAATRTPSEGRGAPRMYDFNVGKQAPGDAGARALALIGAAAPPLHVARAGSSGLAKLVAWHFEEPLRPGEVLSHQAEFVASQLLPSSSPPFTSDWHNALKTGFDVRSLCWPEWICDPTTELGAIVAGRLPEVVPPGAPVGRVSDTAVRRWGLRPDCVMCAGTTDSNAAFLASGASETGDAVTSLGSTLAIKMLSAVPVDDSSRGVYSHRLGDLWLAGGASNVGCAVLREERFSPSELRELSAGIDSEADPPVPGYYPLPRGAVGERFPTNDPELRPVLDPVPESRRDFLHSILHAVGRVEAQGYGLLASLGASPLRRVYTCGGGARNPTWTRMRRRMLGVEVEEAPQTEAAVGVALLALRGGGR